MRPAPANSPPASPPPCGRCQHHFVTYEASMPHGCRLFGIRSQRLPSMIVRQETGQDCTAFELKPGHVTP
ncbi:MAG: hypothetical protein H8D72_01690 [Planctomycetes bacterium]|nr:hypothetical protein [Planctomycetota bacterium]